MRTLIHRPRRTDRTHLLSALLSGTYSEPEDFGREGFADAVSDNGIDAEVLMAPVRAAWFADGSIVRRIRDSVVRPAQRRGRSRIWLCGISLGGLAALSYAARHEGDIEGIVLISPYPATRDVLREMDEAGGLGQWEAVIPPEGDLQPEAWLGRPPRRDRHPPAPFYLPSGPRFAPRPPPQP